MRPQNEVKASAFGRLSIPAKIALVIDGIILVCIALGQLLLSVYVLFIQFTYAYMGGYHAFITPYMVFGVVSAAILPSCRLGPRLAAMAWQAILVGTIVVGVRSAPANSFNAGLKDFALKVSPATLYLLASAVVQFYRRKSLSKSRDGTGPTAGTGA